MPHCQKWFFSPQHAGCCPNLSDPYQQGGTVLHITHPEPRSRIGFISDKERPSIRQFAESITVRGVIT
jgi:hypothetical protein